MNKIAILGNYTLDILSKEISKIYKDKSVYTSGFDEYYQDLINNNSDYVKFNPDLSLLLLDGNTLLKKFKTIKDVKNHIHDVVNLFLDNNHGYLILSNIYISSSINKINFYNNDNNLKEIEIKINLHLQKIAKNKRIFIFDLATIIQEEGWKNLHNNNMWSIGKIRFNKLGNDLIANKIITTINSVNNKCKKCLVLDLDNTLWGGIIGEDGINGINLGPDGLGETFVDFQEKIKQIKKKGVILAICSKNNEKDAKEVFSKHQFCSLKWDDFIIKKINWESKHQNIQEIAAELNIGEDSLVFIDDNPSEREIVSKFTDAIVPDFPNNPTDLGDFIDEIDLRYFSKFNITKEDLQKTKQYKDNIKRSLMQKKSVNLNSFIRDLDLKLDISYNNIDDISRLSQLTQKTNQFNFTTKRYSELEIKNFIKDKKCKVYVGSVKDKFGDYGKVIACIILEKKDKYIIDTLLMSCRVISKQIENYFFDSIILKLEPNKKIYGSFIPTQKNILVENKYIDLGFKLLETMPDKSKKYVFVKRRKLSGDIKVNHE